jgi:DnaJ domain
MRNFLLMALVSLSLLMRAGAFQLQYPNVHAPHQRKSLQPLQSTTTRGMGMGSGTSSSKKSSKKDKKDSGSNNKGMGKPKNGSKASSSTTPFDASAALLRLEKKYEEIQQASTRSLHSDEDDDSTSVASEMIVAVRASKSKTAGGDWVPFANLCVHPHAEVSSEWVHAAVSLYCRELSFCATQGAKVFSAVPRNELQYAIEPVDSFFKHVYDPLMKDQQKGSDIPMSKAEARELLEIDDDTNDAGDDERSRIKKSYRRKSFEWHPDRLDLANMSEDEQEHAAQQYARIQKAFNILSSDARTAGSSWYRSLGGRDRTDFQVIQELMGMDAASSILERHGVQTAVAGLDPDLVQLFVARNRATVVTPSSSA